MPCLGPERQASRCGEGLPPLSGPWLHAPTQVKMQKGERQMAKRFLEERKEELEEVAQELAETEHENTVLRHNIERIKEEKDYTM